MLLEPLRAGHFDLKILKYFLENNLKLIGKKGNVKLIDVRRGNSFEWATQNIVSSGAASTSVVKWLLRNRYPWSPTASSCAAKHGNLDLIKWAVHNVPQFVWCEDTTAKAAKYGHFELLKWCVNKGCPWAPETTSKAAKNNHPHIIEWAILNGADWCEKTVLHAAKYGHLELVEWCLDVGWRIYSHMYGQDNDLTSDEIMLMCPGLLHLTAAAAEGKHLDIIQYCLKRHIPWSRRTLTEAMYNHDIPMMQWCLDHGCRWTYNTLQHISDIPVYILQWCIDHGCPKHHLALRFIADSRDYTAFEWCLVNKFPWRRKNKGVPWSKTDFAAKHILHDVFSNVHDVQAVKWFISTAAKSNHDLKWIWGSYTLKSIVHRAFDSEVIPDLTQFCYMTSHISRCHIVKPVANANANLNAKDLREPMAFEEHVAHLFEFVRWCVNRGCRWGSASIDDFLSIFSIQQLNWCMDNRCRFTRNTINLIISKDVVDVQLLKWALKINAY